MKIAVRKILGWDKKGTTMKTMFTFALAATAFAAVPATAVTNISVTNASFETLPQGGLPSGCGTGCSYSEGSIPGWTMSGANGQFQPGTDVSNFTYFSTLADGPTSAYSNGGTITQQVGGAVVAGQTYKLIVSLGARNDGIASTGQILLSVGATTVSATGVAPTVGNWSDYTATYTALAGDAGGPVIITLLNAGGGQGNWDNVRLDVADVPEPASWAMLIAGFGLTGATMRRRRSVSVAA